MKNPSQCNVSLSHPQLEAPLYVAEPGTLYLPASQKVLNGDL